MSYMINNRQYSLEEIKEALLELGYRFEVGKVSFWHQCGHEDCEEVRDVLCAVIGDEKPNKSNMIYSVALKEFTIRYKRPVKPKLKRQI